MIYNVLKKPDVFYIGKQDENNAETIDIDYSAWVEKYGEGVITATFQGAEDENPYDIVLTTANGIATWTVTDANTVAAGVGKLQLNYVVDEVVAKSLIWTVRVYPSMRASGEAPGGYQDWLTALQGLSAETQQNAQNAANSATEAEEYAEQSKASADSITGLTVEAETLPAGSSATASFDADTDKLSLGIPRGDKGEKGDTGQDGITPDLTIGTTETLPAGSSATATITGTKENPVLNLGIPQGTQGIQGERGGKGDTGATPDISIGTVETLNPDESATATITGTAEDPVLNLGIPKGDTGAAGADGFSPSASVTKQDGNITITVTDKDGTTSETLEVDNALDEDSVNPVQNAAIVEAMRSMLPVDTASGSIASFPDGADDVPMLSLKAQIEPVQDLNGYDSPWPAGGGKNKFNPNSITWKKWVLISNVFKVASDSEASISFSVSGETISITTTSVYRGIGFAIDAVDYDRVVSITNSNIGLVILYSAYEDNATVINSGATSCLIPANTSGFIAIRVNSASTVSFNEQIESGSTASAWSPYSNECPISGHTEVKVQKRGKNLWGGEQLADDIVAIVPGAVKDANAKTVTYLASNVVSKVLLRGIFKENTQYTFFLSQATGSNSVNMMLIYTDGTSGYFNQRITTSAIGKTVSHVEGVWASGRSILNYDECGVFEGVLTANDFEPYQGETITQEFVDGQGNTLTVYGGESEIVRGKLKVDRAMVDLGTLTWTYIGKFYAPLDGAKIPATQQTVPDIMCLCYFASNYHSLVNAIVDKAIGIDPNGNAYVRDSAYSNAAAFKAAMSGVQLVYELATPQTYQLTPQEVRTFLGQNNIWADTGDTEVVYRADIQKYIEKKVSA